MGQAAYRLDWARPVARHLPGERSYHVTDGTRHLLVVMTTDQILAAERLARSQRRADPDVSVQAIVEDAIERAMTERPPAGGALRLSDADFT